MRTAILIPARHASRRFPGKPLAPITLPDGRRRSLIEMTWRAASRVPDIDAVHVLTDDARIARHARGFGASVIMTSPEAENGTARCAEALLSGAVEAELLINLQGDAPLTPPWFVTALCAAMRASPTADMATPVLRCDPQSWRMLREDRLAGRVGATTAVFDASGRALYFSKELIPWIDPDNPPRPLPLFHHVGLYAYRPEALAAYARWPESPLERAEGLEQLRFLHHGAEVLCVQVEARGRPFWEVNNPHDIPRIEHALRHLNPDNMDPDA